MRLVCADTNRARQTADQLYRGVPDGLQMWGATPRSPRPEPIPELRNFGVWTPDGLRDVTSAFRQYQATIEKLERIAVGDRPRWLVEIDRFYRTQLGGADPIQHVADHPADVLRAAGDVRAPVLARVPPADRRVARTTPILAATHSGPMRAFATWAHGYDPGEPLNTEEIRVKVRRAGGPRRLLPQPGHRGERPTARRVPEVGRMSPSNGKATAAIVGPGNIGTDLLAKLRRSNVDRGPVHGRRGRVRRARTRPRRMGLDASAEGVDWLLRQAAAADRLRGDLGEGARGHAPR